MKKVFTFIIILVTLSACKMPQVKTTEPVAIDESQANRPNPASVFCVQHGNELEIHRAADGSQSGVCVFQTAAPVMSGPIFGANAALEHRQAQPPPLLLRQPQKPVMAAWEKMLRAVTCRQAPQKR
jgi:putative hemolysin